MKEDNEKRLDCDTRELRSRALKLAKAKEKMLRAAGLPVSSRDVSDIQKQSFAEVRADCEAVSSEVTAEQMKLWESVCPPCAARRTVKVSADATDATDATAE